MQRGPPHLSQGLKFGIRSGLPRESLRHKVHATILHAMKITISLQSHFGLLIRSNSCPIWTISGRHKSALSIARIKPSNIAVRTKYLLLSNPTATSIRFRKTMITIAFVMRNSLPPLFKALQDLTAQLDAQHEEIKALKEQLTSFKVTWASTR